jgi:hypothetical protein
MPRASSSDGARRDERRPMRLVPCLGCGGLFPDGDGPTHRHMESSRGCWAAFGELSAREYGDLCSAWAAWATHQASVRLWLPTPG